MSNDTYNTQHSHIYKLSSRMQSSIVSTSSFSFQLNEKHFFFKMKMGSHWTTERCKNLLVKICIWCNWSDCLLLFFSFSAIVDWPNNTRKLLFDNLCIFVWNEMKQKSYRKWCRVFVKVFAMVRFRMHYCSTIWNLLSLSFYIFLLYARIIACVENIFLRIYVMIEHDVG